MLINISVFVGFILVAIVTIYWCHYLNECVLVGLALIACVLYGSEGRSAEYVENHAKKVLDMAIGCWWCIL